MMDTLLTVAQWVLPLAYLALVIDYGATFFLRIRTHVREPWVLAVVVLHAGFLVAWSLHHGYAPVFTAYEVLTLIALFTTMVYAAAERIVKDRRIGVFVFLVVFLLQYTGTVFMVAPEAGPTSEAVAQREIRTLHTVPAAFAYTALALAAIHAALHLIGRRNLKQHKFGLLFDRLPPLELLTGIRWYALLASLLFMTIAVVTGMLVASGATHAPDQKVIVKIVLGSVTWLVCAAAVLGKWLLKFSESRVSLIAVGGFAIVAALFIASMVLS